jgi:hypothetical protein
MDIFMKRTATLLVSALLAGFVFWLSVCSLDLIQHVPDPVKRSLSVYGPVFTAVLVFIGAWLRRRGHNAEAE